MTTLHWDLTEQATRQYILATTLAQMPDEQACAVRDAVVATAVPARHHHNLAEVLETIGNLSVDDRVKDDMRSIYRILSEAEATVHRCSVEETHFHEVGNGEAVENVLAVCLAVAALAPEEITASLVQTGEGTVVCAHGELDIPAPATAAIIASGIPVCADKLPGERCTPTSAAIILHFVDRFESTPGLA